VDQPCRMWYADSSDRIAGSALDLACSWSLACSSAALSYTRMRIVVRISGSLSGCGLIGGRLWLDRAPGLPFIIGLAIGSILVLDWNSGTGNPGPQGLSSCPASQATTDLYIWPLGVQGLIYLGLGPHPAWAPGHRTSCPPLGPALIRCL